MRVILGVERLSKYDSLIRGKRIGDREYGYGCRFVDLSDNAEAVIREYVFRVLKEKDHGRR